MARYIFYFLYALFIIIIYIYLYQVIPETKSNTPLEISKNPLSLAGHSSFINAVLGGYGGLQLTKNALIVDPTIPNGKKAWSILGVDYQGFVLDLKFTKEEIHIRVVKAPHNAVLYLETTNKDLKVEIKKDIIVARSKIALSSELKHGNHWSRDPWLWQSRSLPEAKYMPEVGNGHIATMVYNPWVYMNGLYNGLGPKSSRARIPSFVGFSLKTNHSDSHLVEQGYTLDVHKGTFAESQIYRNPGLVVTRVTYAHREIDHLLVTNIKIMRLPNSISEDVAFYFENIPNQSLLESDDLTFQPTSHYDRFQLADGKNRISEVAGTPLSNVTIAWNEDFANFTLPAGNKTLEKTFYQAVSTNSDDVVATMKKVVGMEHADILAAHIAKWRSYWDNGRIDVPAEENFPMAQALYGAYYYLLSSLPNKEDETNPFVGLSPGGLARGAINTDYSGHIFWDTETWMYPPILYFHPEQAKLLIKSRSNTLDAAKKNAEDAGKRGAKYAWESAVSGNEVSPWPPSGEYEIHITGDIAFAVRQLLYASDKKKELIEQLRLQEMAVEIARYWKSRVTYNQHNDTYSIIGVMPPDEYHFPVDDSVYTNYVAKLSLELPEYIFQFTGGSDSELHQWKNIAKKLVFLQSTFEGKPFHVEFGGFMPGEWNPASNVNDNTVKQGDVILLGYPLDMPMNATLRANDLDIYRPITDEKGPAMTWGMFSVGYLELGRHAEADELFNKNFDNIVQPFGVWSEVNGGEGALNFLTGMGGFLQAVVNGYGGFRLREHGLLVNPHPLPGTTKWTFVGYKHVGYQLDIGCDAIDDVMTFTTTKKDSSVHLVLEADGIIIDLSKVGKVVKVRRGEGLIRPIRDTDVLIDSDNGGNSGCSLVNNWFVSLIFALIIIMIIDR